MIIDCVTVIPKAPEKPYYPVSLQQEGVWLQAALDPDHSVWNTSHSWRFEGELDIDALKQAVQQLIIRHAALRTNFKLIDEKIYQFIHTEISMTDYFFYYDFSSYPDNEKERAAAALEKEAAQKPYELEKEPLIRFTLIRLGQDDHVLVVSKHHIISDVTSRQIMWRELSSLYKTYSTGGPDELEPVTIQYHDYSVWQQEFLKSDCYQAQKKYWLSELPGKDSLPRLNLPTDYPRTETLAKVSTYRVALEPGLVGKIRTFSLQKRVSFSSVFLAAFYILLNRYSGQDDIIIGTLYRGRNRDKKNLGKVVGLFVNHVAVRMDLGDRAEQLPSVELLENIHLKFTAAYNNQDFLFEDLLRTLHPDRTGGYAPVFQAVFNMIKVTFPGMALEGLNLKEWQGCELDTNIATHYDLSLFIRDDFKEMSAEILYSQALFNDRTIERMALQYKQLLSGIIEYPGQRVADTDIITEAERRQIIYEFNNTAAAYPEEKTIHRLFEDQVERAPDVIALVGAGPRVCPNCLTYRHLNEQSDRLAGLLIEKGVLPDSIVGIMIERSIEMVIGIFGILKAGSAYLPIDPSYPEERIDYMLADSNAKILLGMEECQKKIIVNCQLLIVNCKLKNVPQAPFHHSSFIIHHSNQLAYIIYTSGSTGRPKGVVIEHSSVINLLFALFRTYPFTHMDCYLLKTAYVFDVSVTELFGWFLGGGRLAVLEPGGEKDPQKIIEVIAKLSVTHINFVPSMFNVFLDLLNLQGADGLRRLKYIFLAGEALMAESVRKFKRAGAAISLENLYGPTESTVYASGYSLSGWDGGGGVPIGKPIANTGLVVLSKGGRLQPIGIAGELHIGGDGLARGYLNRPELTAERFIKYRSYRTNRTNVIYKTGDLARWLAHGNIEFLGRIDHQVKIRGFRIELGEIESALNEHPIVKEAIVTAVTIKNNIPGEDGAQSLCAYVTLSPSRGADLDAPTLKEYLAKKLPAYMVPSYFIKLEKFPLTHSGKIDRKALPEPLAGLNAGQTQGDYTAPQNEVQQALVFVWQEVLGIQKVGTTDNFFTMGGESIKAIQVSSRLAARGYRLEIARLFKYPFIDRLWEYVKKKETTGVVDQKAISGEIKPIPIQQWFLDRGFSYKHHWNLAMMLHREQGLEADILQRVFKRLVEHHDVLRAVLDRDERILFNKDIIPAGDGDPGVSLEIIDLLQAAAGDLAERIESEANRVQASIDLFRGPLIKTALFKTVSGDHLLIVIHHLVIDGVSWRILLEDISSGYEQAGEGKEIVFPAKTHSFKQWSETLAAYSRIGKLRQEYDYWREICTSAAGKKEKGKGKGKLKDYHHCKIELDEEESRLFLKEAHRAYNTEINDLLLGALALALRDCFGWKQTVIHLEGHGREPIAGAIDIERTVGWFTGLFPVLLEAREQDDLSMHIRRVKENLRKIPLHGIGYGILRYLADLPEADRQGLEIESTVGFNYLGQFDADLQRTGFKRSPFAVGHSKSPECEQVYKININGLTEDSRLTFMINGDTGTFPEEQIEILGRCFKSALQQIAGHCAGIKETIFTPVDFEAKDLALDELETIYEHFGRHNISEIYNLSPMQEGMLFHYLYDSHDRAYTVQLFYSLEGGDVDVALLKASYEKLVESREIFRTAFIYKGVKRPRQVVLKTRASEFTYHDIPGEERQREFDLQRDILIRFTLIKTDPGKYTLLITYHHIIMDGWSTNLWLKDFLDLYCDMKNNKVPRLEVAPPYSSYIKWLAEQDIEGANAYWRNYLDGFDQVTRLQAYDHTVDTVAGNNEYKRGDHTVVMAKEMNRRLTELGKRLGVTLNNILQAVWSVVLHRYLDVEDVVFGNVISGRSIPLEGVEKIVGLFINTIPMRLQIKTGQTFGEFAREISENLIQSQTYGYLSLAEVQAQVANISAGGRLFEHLFIFENYPVNKDLTGRGQAEKTGFAINRQFSIEQTNYNLNIVIIPRDDLVLRFQYNENIYEKTFVMRLAGYIERVIEQVVFEAGMPISDIEIVTGDEKRRLLYEFNNTVAAYPNDKTIHGLFEDQVEKTPDYIAISGGPVELTYRELNDRADRVAGLLIEKGVLADSIVGIMIERSLEMMIGIYGILKAGGAYLPIDPSYPQERIDYMLNDSGAKIMIGRAEFVFSCFFLASLLPRFLASDSSNLAYLIYTSGSTGKPKGVLIEHRSLVNRLNWMQKHYTIGQGDTILHKTPFTFDVSVWEIFWWSMVGARVYLLASGGEKDPKQIATAIYMEHVTVMHFVPSMLRAFLEYIEESGAPGAAGRLSSLKQVFASGEALTAPLVIRFNTLLNKTRLANLYGPTEATIDVSYFDCPLEEDIERIPIGKPIDNTGLVVLSKGGQLQPIGAAGELCIGGVGLARGYLNRPELTAERFYRSYRSYKTYIFYKTGDVARWLPGGNIEFLGRIDHQVKIRGNRIELGEIESLLNRHIAVKESVVIAVNDPSGENSLCAYIVSNNQNIEELNVEHLRIYLGKTLPEYMIPSYFVPIEKIPLTASGKADRKSLPRLEPGKTLRTGATYEKPSSAIEEKLVALWQELLKVERVGIHDNFFSLGGHSLKAMNFIGQVYKTFDLEIPLRLLFDKPTISGIAQWIEDKVEKRRKLAQILQEIEALSDEQVNELVSGGEYVL